MVTVARYVALLFTVGSTCGTVGEGKSQFGEVVSVMPVPDFDGHNGEVAFHKVWQRVSRTSSRPPESSSESRLSHDKSKMSYALMATQRRVPRSWGRRRRGTSSRNAGALTEDHAEVLSDEAGELSADSQISAMETSLDAETRGLESLEIVARKFIHEVGYTGAPGNVPPAAAWRGDTNRLGVQLQNEGGFNIPAPASLDTPPGMPPMYLPNQPLVRGSLRPLFNDRYPYAGSVNGQIFP
eukprot:TRINITY_DN29342_c0_g1_i1.p1 TRINITY_DN29342_c0_g1~~TRINITY_DN29342_c0_g1_i1.p1  ORF type:complete len:240 (+),score=25.64 TRINITY_DN29342_c0_g1_i1:57-776(+)